MLDSLKRLPLLFLIILIVAVTVSLWLRVQFNFNAGHMDEYDYLFVGKRLLSGATWPSYSYIFGSDLNWYVLGLGDRWLGGLSGARTVAGLFGLLSLAGVYGFVYCLWSRHITACLAVALMSLQSIQLFISRFATYDIISFAYFSLALTPLLLACTRDGRRKYIYLLVAIALMSLAITSKYIVILYLPLLAGLAFLRAPHIGLLFGIAVGVILLCYIQWHWDALQTLYRVQIQGVHGVGNGSVQYIVTTTLGYLGVLLVGWLVAMMWSIGCRSGPARLTPDLKKLLLLLLLALPMAVYHLNAHNMISLFKHLVYATLFLIPAVAWLLTRLLISQKHSGLKQVLASIFIIFISVINYQQLKSMEKAYANVTPVIKLARLNLSPTATVLSEDPYLFRYLGEGVLPQAQIKESGWLDNNLDGNYEAQDVIDAIWDRKFGYVFLNDQLHPTLNKKLRKILKMKRYKPLVNETYQITDVMSRQVTGKLSLYQRVPPKQEKYSDN